MASAALRWKRAGAIQLGLLLLIFLTSGNSALECYTITKTDIGNATITSYPGSSQMLCSGAENACVEVQLKFIVDKNIIFMNHRGCAKWDSKTVSESATSGNQHYRIESNVTYCLHDLCNVETSPANISITPGGEQVPETTRINQHHCFSGLTFDRSEPSLGPVRCHEGYDKCYQSRAAIIVGTPQSFTSSLVFIRTCQNATNAVPQRQSFARVTIAVEEDSYCSGSLCNGKWGPPHLAPGAYGPIRHWHTKPISPPQDAGLPDHRQLQAAAPECSTIHPCLLLVTLRTIMLGIW
ncbi:uncharacterized protein LOC123026081 [Varanus komodoensis]|uniref:uncharacterized protein LOC123026081 n=1 Tax=Varanus komodoensis TaxID=61221 RepID=UPI001CF7BBC3|nr:uncharacterized protein LOC123026081 [Varanus komodoensis]